MLGDAFQAVVDAWASAMGRVAIAGTMVLLVAGWAERRIGARSPRARSWIWRFAWIQLVLLMVPGSGRLQLPESWRPPQDWDWVVPGRTEVAARGVPRPSDRIGVTASSLGVPPSAIPGEDPLGEGGMPRPPESWGATTAAFVVWLVLALGWVALLGWQRGTALRWIARSEPAKDPRLGAWIAEWKEELRRRIRSAGSRRMLDRLEVRVHPDVCSPRVAGVWRPTILLPTDGGVLGTEEAARAVLTHEWGHVVRGDLAWRWLRGWIRAALFFHPLVAWAERRTLVAEEMACDRMAMDGGKLSPAAFGKLLVRLAEAERSVARSRRMGLAAGMSRQAAGLLERMHGLASVEGRSSRRRLMMVGAWVVLMGVLGWVSLGGAPGYTAAGRALSCGGLPCVPGHGSHAPSEPGIAAGPGHGPPTGPGLHPGGSGEFRPRTAVSPRWVAFRRRNPTGPSLRQRRDGIRRRHGRLCLLRSVSWRFPSASTVSRAFACRTRGRGGGNRAAGRPRSSVRSTDRLRRRGDPGLDARAGPSDARTVRLAVGGGGRGNGSRHAAIGNSRRTRMSTKFRNEATRWGVGWLLLLASGGWTTKVGAQIGGVGGGVGGGASVNGVAIPMTTTGTQESVSWGGRSSAVSLLADEEVRKELGLSAAQRTQVAEWVSRVRQAGMEDSRTLQRDTQTGTQRLLQRAKQREQRLAALERDIETLGQRIRVALNPAQQRIVDQACAKDLADAGGPKSSGGGFGVVGGGGVPSTAGVVVATNVASGGGGYASGGTRGSVVRVMRFPTVRRSLALTPEQAGIVDAALADLGVLEADLRQDMQALRPEPLVRPGIRPTARRASDLSAQANTELAALLTPDQKTRLDQISLQVDGVEALFRPEVVDALKLNATQQARLASVSQQTRKRAESYLFPPHARVNPTPGGAPIVPPAGRVPPPDHAAVDRVQQQGALGMMAVLTTAQRQTFERMMGRPFPGIARLEGFGGSTSSEVRTGKAREPGTPE